MSQQFGVRERGNPNAKVKFFDWQNASELVSHGRFEWASGGSGADEFAKAKKQAKATNTQPQGFEHLKEVETSNDDDDDHVPTTPVIAPKVTIADVAQAKVEPKDPYAELTKDELFAEAEKRELNPDKRLGTKSLQNLLREDDAAKDD